MHKISLVACERREDLVVLEVVYSLVGFIIWCLNFHGVFSRLAYILNINIFKPYKPLKLKYPRLQVAAVVGVLQVLQEVVVVAYLRCMLIIHWILKALFVLMDKSMVAAFQVVEAVEVFSSKQIN